MRNKREQGNLAIGRERTNWYDDHSSACTCAECGKRRSAQNRFNSITQGRKVGRNESCPCGSKLKYKKCHGA
ncbi:hypothetical protein FIL93_00630 [SAR202 cluster bacterium AD-493-K16_JPT_193m]|nr:hypothetical protein [SAR202 cluster bacterium AD-493-K16_JPT_193m]